MNLLVMGGSNSVMADGWVSHLQDALLPHWPALAVQQISVGATSSMAAIGRLHESAESGAPVDLILYEYSINDGGHFGWREHGAESWLLCLSLLLQAAARLYPDALFVPVVFSQRPHFSRATAHPFHDAQIAAFDALALPAIDLRQALATLFLDRAPQWLYQDDAHYAAPCATSLVGHLVAAHLLSLAARAQTPLRDVPARLPALHQRFGAAWPGLQGIYVPAVQLAAFTQGRVAPERTTNRLMTLNCLRMAAGSQLAMRSEMALLGLFIKSDRQHAFADLRLQDTAGKLRHSRFSTRHADTASLPFVYGSIPVPMLFGHRLAAGLGAGSFALSVPAEPPPPPAALRRFDCYVHPESHLQETPAEQRLDLVGVLFAVLQ